MKPITYDFDVVTDAPRIAQSPKRRAPEPAEKSPQAEAEGERRGAAPPESRPSVQAAE
jgi:hypothetical protein